VSAAHPELEEATYRELKRIAGIHFAQERAEHTLSRTALVHEAWLRLAQYEAAREVDRDGFLRLASRVMRHLLVDHARARNAAKRGGDAEIVSLDRTTAVYARRCLADMLPAPETGETPTAFEREIDFLRLDSALAELARRSPRQAEVVELKFFSGQAIEDIARTLGISPATVKREWSVARLFLLRALSDPADGRA
jgi:RNA polymerase sigma factor (sigma-70 family)